MIACLALSLFVKGADTTFVYAVQLSARVSASPAGITLQWPPDPYGAFDYTIWRKAKDSPSWGQPLANLPGHATSYDDTTVTVGQTYEYQVIKNATLGYIGTGYLLTGIEVPPVEDRGRVLLVIATNKLASLAAEIATLESDLAGDGWTVVRLNVSESHTPDYVRNLIQGAFWDAPSVTRSVFLVGHVPVLQSGYLDYDGHLARPMPADAFYGDIDGYWPTQPGSSPSYLPSNLELAVGRVDFHAMPGSGADAPWPTETELLRNYLRKNHAWRNKLLNVPRRALMGNRRGDEGGLATAASGYRGFQPLVGPGNIIEANTENRALPNERWISHLSAESYLLAYGCGGGQPTGIGGLGSHGDYNEAWSTDVVDWDAKAVFVMLFGSWFGNWDGSDNFMRAFLATPSLGLAACMSGEPHWFIHHLALGDTLGDAMRLSINNENLYTSQVMDFTRAVYIALMGDPTLRLEIVPPPANLQAYRQNTSVLLSWTPSPQPVLGYHLYRSASQLGGYTRLTANPVQTTTWTDTNPFPAAPYYQVRAIELENHFSGSFYNLSQGALAVVTENVTLRATQTAAGISLTWNTRLGQTYRVQATTGLSASWIDQSPPLTATSSTYTWTDPSQPPALKLYRIKSP